MRALSFLLLGLLSAVAMARPKSNNTDLICRTDQVRLLDDVIREAPRMTSPARNGMLNETLRWPGGRIPYEINTNYTEEEQETIRSGIEAFMNETDNCIRLEPRNESDINYVEFSGEGGGGQVIDVEAGINCVERHTILHEIMHVVGFDYEQNRPDRDDYVIIHWENIDPEYREFFEKRSLAEADTFGESFDFDSVMLYDQCAYSSNGLRTITPKDGVEREFGWAETLSPSDVRKIKRMYGCPI